MNTKELFQNEVLEEFKTIAKELSQINNFSGLLMHQQKIQGLYEKFIFLKQLNSMKYQDILENNSAESTSNYKEVDIINVQQTFQTTTPVEKKTISITEENPITPTKAVISDPIIESKETVTTPEKLEEKTIEKPVGKEIVATLETEKIQGETLSIEIEKNSAKNVETVEEKTEKLSPISIQIAEIKPPKKEKILKPVKLDLNDSIAFISQLFNGSKVSMDLEITTLNETKNIEEARKWIEEMFHKYDWKNKAEYVERLSELIITRFA